MTEQTKPKRKSSLSYRVPKALEAELERRLALSGLTVNAFLTEAWYGRSRIRPDENLKLAQLLAEEQRQSDLLRSLDIDALELPQIHALLETIAEEKMLIRTALLRLMGRAS